MVGGALVRRAQTLGFDDVITASRSELDLTRQSEVEEFLATHKPDTVIIAAAKVGGIHANNTFPAEFIHENLAIASHLIHASHLADVKRLLFLGSSCIYPKLAPQPISEDHLLTSELEPTNEAYAIAKIAGLKMCEYYRQQYDRLYHSAMPCNLYGPGDNYHPENSHVIPALIRRFHEAKEAQLEEVQIWGTGTPLREFLYVDDLAEACFHLLQLENPPSLVNVGAGTDLSILELSKLIAQAVGFQGAITTDPSKPDGTPRKLMNSERMASLGWQPKTPLREGFELAYQDFLSGNFRSQ